MGVDNVWSVITVVPRGHREFCYLADGAFTVSTKHPVNGDGTCNWRNVYGPPTRTPARRGVRELLLAALGEGAPRPKVADPVRGADGRGVKMVFACAAVYAVGAGAFAVRNALSS